MIDFTPHMTHIFVNSLLLEEIRNNSTKGPMRDTMNTESQATFLQPIFCVLKTSFYAYLLYARQPSRDCFINEICYSAVFNCNVYLKAQRRILFRKHLLQKFWKIDVVPSLFFFNCVIFCFQTCR